MSEELKRYNDLFTVQFRDITKKIDALTLTSDKVHSESIKHNERQKNEVLKLSQLNAEVSELKKENELRKVTDNQIKQTQVLQARELEVCINLCQRYNKIATSLLILVLSTVIYSVMK